jgi:DNA (cytosine-5)-methyltransferase 1
MRTVHTDISRRRFAETGEGEVEPISRFFKLARNGVCNPLRAGTDSARGAFTSPRPIHYVFSRCVTPEMPVRQIDLGRPELLSLDMGDASEYGKVPVPTGKRDRKNGLRKRRQSEIEASAPARIRSVS